MASKDLNIRQERAIAGYIKTGVRSRAYINAGYKASTRGSLDAAASRLFRNVKIKAALRQKRQQMLKRSDVTIEKLLRDCAEDRELARSLEQPSAAIAATQLTAKLVGLLIDRKESGSPGDFDGLNTADEVLERARERLSPEAFALVQAAVAPPQAQPEPIEPSPSEPNAPTSDAMN